MTLFKISQNPSLFVNGVFDQELHNKNCVFCRTPIQLGQSDTKIHVNNM